MTTTRAELIATYLPTARWFGGKGRDFRVETIINVPVRSGSDTEPLVEVWLVEVRYLDDTTEEYQVPVSTYAEPQTHLNHAFLGTTGAVTTGARHHYDAVHDRAAMAAWLDGFAQATPTDERGRTVDRLAFHRVEDTSLDTSVHSTLLAVEQSNSSVAFGEDSILKVFRRVSSGPNPDIELHRALTAAGSTHVAALLGWVELPHQDPAQMRQLGILQQFLRTASDGWELALASVRNLYSEADLDAAEVGGDFAAEAHRLGQSVAEVHVMLAEAFPTAPFDPAPVRAAMAARHAEAVAAVPELAAEHDRITAVLDRIGDCRGRIQRIHGDLHLGQTLRTSLGWKVIDFEGEPAVPLAARRRPDSVWRDVAGMMRSFDYAAQVAADDLAGTPEAAAHTRDQALEWAARNTTAFLAGYVAGRGGEPLTTVEEQMVAVYRLDKVLYEVTYEARNRPPWLSVPVGALRRILEGVS